MRDHAAGEAGQELGRGQQPVRKIHPAGRVNAEPVDEERPRGGHLHLVVRPAAVTVAVGIDHREAVEPGRQPLQGDVDRRGVKAWRDEQLHTGTEIVVRGNLVIEAEHLGTVTEQRGGTALDIMAGGPVRTIAPDIVPTDHVGSVPTGDAGVPCEGRTTDAQPPDGVRSAGRRLGTGNVKGTAAREAGGVGGDLVGQRGSAFNARAAAAASSGLVPAAAL
ncbi:hypothetical protein I6A84_02845 [Frankia sp. CNm7]|uniref:Uncharacterized protein n=1 Tax=Frankia nepalensis TaxID=1836974 RepID=A0A937RF73_9ACTN|nr:hypothetical protein [Frankia nepalensis]MBL7497584.1 hypothetical protein [Frankia nepalensis]MBL7509603.1 hypothetical protein [Frankia nepalensis]MBL7517090.1 hypothetical protein [Frankia nepalensis]MBL7631038.1 hypothetical protein [Frankia nepalensis]